MMFRLCCVVVHITRLPDENADMCAITSLYSTLSVHLHILSMLVPVSPGETDHAPVPYHHLSLGGITCGGASSRFPNIFSRRKISFRLGISKQLFYILL